MKVFISWSGEKSKQVAELMDTWLQCTIQSSEPWLSGRSIDRGALWFSEILTELADTNLGIICLTKENKDKPWILFEAGAIAKGLTSNRVCTFLVDLEPIDLENPLAQFNHTIYTKESLEQLLITINSLIKQPLKPNILQKVFDKYWPEFQENFEAILAQKIASPTPVVKRNKEDLMSEVLSTVRGLDKRMMRIESNVSNNISSGEINNNDVLHSKLLTMTKRMLAADTPVDLIRIKLENYGLSDIEVNNLIMACSMTKKTVDVTNDMLEQLKVKFGK